MIAKTFGDRRSSHKVPIIMCSIRVAQVLISI